VGMTPRRNPEIAVVVLQEHGDWGSGSAKLAAQVITAYVNKKRKQEGNLLLQANKPDKPVEMGAVWSAPETPSGRKGDVAGKPRTTAGRFVIPMDKAPVLAKENVPLFPDRVPYKSPRSPESPVAMQTEASLGLPERFRGVIP